MDQTYLGFFVIWRKEKELHKLIVASSNRGQAVHHFTLCLL